MGSAFDPAAVQARVKTRWEADSDYYAEAIKDLPTNDPARRYRNFEELRAAASPGTSRTEEENLPSWWQRLTSPTALFGFGGLALAGASTILPGPALLVGASAMLAAGAVFGIDQAVAANKRSEAEEKQRRLEREATERQRQILSQLLDSEGNAAQHLHAVEKLIASDHPLKTEALNTAINWAIDNREPTTARAAAQALGSALYPTTLSRLINTTKDKYEPYRRMTAVSALMKRTDPEIIEALLRTSRDDHPNVRIQTVYAFSEIKDVPGIIPALIAMLRDADPQVRLAAVKALRDSGDPEVRSALERTLQNETDQTVRDALADMRF
jgi:hypothetical protein